MVIVIANQAKTPKPAAEWIELETLKAWDRNPRKNDANVKRVAESIKRLGFASPIIARLEDREIIAGHTRAQAAKVLGLTKVPVRFMDLDPSDAHLLALADNKLNEFSAWDEDRLVELLGDLRQQSSDAALVAGWSDGDIDKLLSEAAPVGIDGASEVDEAEAFGKVPSGEKMPFRDMTFTLHDSQVDDVCNALEAIKSSDDFAGSPNKNANANALHVLARRFLDG